MTDKIVIYEITNNEDALLPDVQRLFEAMYAEMERHGLNIGLAEDGAATWMESITRGMGRFGCLFVALSGDDLLAFAHGSIRLTPDYLANRKVGVITHIFVEGKYRRKGIAQNLVKKLEEWFAAKGVHSVELQVLTGNWEGIAFWEKLGYPAELHQHRKAGNKL